MAAKKGTKRPVKSPARKKRTQPHGGELLTGNPGNRGGSGRPKTEFKLWCQGLLDDDKNREQVEQILGDKNHPAHAQMFKAIADRAHGKPKQSVEVDTGASLTALLAQAFGKRET